MILYTFGYTGQSFPAFLDLIRAHNVLLVDSRLVPFSRNEKWGQPHLITMLGEQYRHIPQLGNLLYKGGGIQLNDPAQGYEILHGLLQQQSVVLLCGCSDLHRCHRHYIAQNMEKIYGTSVVHLSRAEIPFL